MANLHLTAETNSSGTCYLFENFSFSDLSYSEINLLNYNKKYQSFEPTNKLGNKIHF